MNLSFPVSKNLLFTFTAFFILITSGCDIFSSRSATIGIITKISGAVPAFTGFKEGMSELGYVEGFNLNYIYREISGADDQLVQQTIHELLGSKADLLITFEPELTLQCKIASKGTGMPIVFISNPFPVEMGLVDSLKAPGANLTGVRMPETSKKSLEWMKATLPHVKTVYLPYNPADAIPESELSGLENAASTLSIDLVIDEVASLEETISTIENRKNDFDSVFRIPSRSMIQHSAIITQAALDCGIPTCSSLLSDADVLMTFSGDFVHAGKLAARLSNQILSGISPSDLPIKTADSVLTINLQSAEKIGATISDEVLSQAQEIIR
jgi:putative ABC transport system substrate-binding protein